MVTSHTLPHGMRQQMWKILVSSHLGIRVRLRTLRFPYIKLSFVRQPPKAKKCNPLFSRGLRSLFFHPSRYGTSAHYGTTNQPQAAR